MITDSQLYTLALFLGSASVLLIILFHFLSVNAVDDTSSAQKPGAVAEKKKGLAINS